MSAMILGGALANAARWKYASSPLVSSVFPVFPTRFECSFMLSPEESVGFVVFPLSVHCLDLLTSTIGVMLVKTTKG